MKIFKRLLFTSLFALQASLGFAAPSKIELQPPTQPIPKAYFGLHIHHLWQDTEWPNVPFGTWRLWDSHTTWAILEPSRGQYDFSLLDKYVDVAESHGVELELTLQGSPTWASARPSEMISHASGLVTNPGTAAEPQSLSDWEDFVRTVATRYKGRIHLYEIWNEPMNRPYYSGTPEAMVALVESAATVLKQVDPSNQVLSPPVTGDTPGLSWLEAFLRAGGGPFVDIWGFHFYVGGPPEKGLPKIQRTRQLLHTYGQDTKPMWNTEAGWQLAHLDPTVGTGYVARALLLGWSVGLGRYFLYSWDHPLWGIAPKGNADTPMVRAYGTIEEWTEGATVTRCIRLPNGLWVENLTMKNGTVAKIVWSENGTIPLTPDHIGTATGYKTLEGQSIPIQPGQSVQASGLPILLM